MTLRDTQGRFASADAEAEDQAAGGQASVNEVSAFGADRAAKDSQGYLRPARVNSRGDTEVILPNGVISAVERYPAVITRMEKLADPVRTAAGLELPWRIGLCTVIGQRGSLPTQTAAAADLEVYAALRRLDRRDHGPLGQTHELAFAFEPAPHALDPDDANPYELVKGTLAHAFEATALEDDKGIVSAHAYIWRCAARRDGAVSAWAGLHHAPELDDAILRPAALAAAYNMVAVPLRRTIDGCLFCAVAPRLGDPHRGATPALVGTYEENALEPDTVTQPEAAYAVSMAMDALNARVADASSKLAASEGHHAAADRRHSDDIDAIGEGLIAEAVRRGWCEDYDIFVESLNGRLNKPLPLRERDYEVEVELSFTVKVPKRAASEDAAMEVVDSDDVREAARDYISNLSSHDWDAQSAEAV